MVGYVGQQEPKPSHDTQDTQDTRTPSWLLAGYTEAKHKDPQRSRSSTGRICKVRVVNEGVVAEARAAGEPNADSYLSVNDLGFTADDPTHTERGSPGNGGHWQAIGGQ